MNVTISKPTMIRKTFNPTGRVFGAVATSASPTRSRILPQGLYTPRIATKRRTRLARLESAVS